MVAKRRKIQMELAFDVGSRGEAPSTGDKGTEATMAKSRTESSASTAELMEEVCERESTRSDFPVWSRNDTLDCPNRRVRDPYARWCGRRGAARRPPIPIPKISGESSSLVHSLASGDPSTRFARSG